MNADPHRLLDELLGPLHMRFLAARELYREYLAQDRRFAFARALRRINGEARDLLLLRGHLLPEALRAEAARLVAHYEVWATTWDDQQRRTNPAPEDPFVFDTHLAYPADAERLIEALRSRLEAGDFA